jgi:hypothetical protein
MATNLKSILRSLLDSRLKEFLIRLIALLLCTLVVVSHFEIFHIHLTAEEFIPALFFLIWLTFEVQLSETRSRDASKQLQMLEWHTAIPILRSQMASAREIIILGSSSESMYVLFKDVMETAHDLTVYLLLRSCDASDRSRLSKQTTYRDYWIKLNSKERNVTVQVKFCDNDVLRGIIIDKSIGFLGFYEWKDGKFWGHSVPLIVAKRNSGPIHNHFLLLYLNRFTRFWEEAHDTASQKNHKR